MFDFDEPTTRIPVDPWPDAPFVTRDGSTRVFRAQPAGRIFGYVYELVLAGQPDDQCSYIGMAQDMARRMAATGSGHRSPTSIAKDPWKADILPGKAGYRILERVRTTGFGEVDDERALRRAEADWIDRRRPVHNDVRPVQPRTEPQVGPRNLIGYASPKAKLVSARVTAEQERKARADRRARTRAAFFLLAFAVFTTLAAWFVGTMHLPWPAAPWIVSPVLGVVGAFWLFNAAGSGYRKVTGRPKRRRR
jgi:hypothetical protein